MSIYKRNYVSGGSYFFTVNLQNRSANYLTEYIHLLREAVHTTKQKRPFKIDAWVVLPDHMHAVWTLPEQDSDFSSRWREIKKHFSKQLPKTEFQTENQKKRQERGIWQRRFWEHSIRSESDFHRHIDYVYLNPVKHGHVGCVKDWPYSSFHRDVKLGIYSEDWYGTIDENTINFGER